jgi:peptidoglycan/xylan/chitin deacetylase (PgdA/CDA1 family)
LLLGVLGAAVVGAAILLWENLDVRQLGSAIASEPGPLPTPEAPLPPGVRADPFSAHLFKSSRNQAFFPDSSHYSRAVARWRRLTESVGGTVVVIESEEELEALEPQDLLVLPEAPCLSAGELAAVRAHLEAGGSLVSNWAVGARDQDCEWRGWQAVAEFTASEDVRELALREALYLTVPGGTALSPGLDPGTRIEFRVAPTLALRAAGPRVYWSDWALNPAPDESGGGADVAASVGGTDGGGRTAWFGFQLSYAATPADSARLDRLVGNGIRWAAGLPMASVAAWPEGKRAALVLAEDVEAEFQNASAMADLLEEMDLPGSFYVVSQLVTNDAELADALSSVGEVGSHSPDHSPLGGLPIEDQRVRLRQGWAEIRGWTGVGPSGLRPPEETFDLNTLRAWRDAGGRYVLAVNQSRSGSPEVYRVNGDPLVLLPRLLKDDYNVFVQDGAVKAGRLTEAFLGGMEKIRSVGGLAVVTVHTQIVGTGSRLEAIRAVGDTARAQGDWWVARAEEVAEWWEERASVRVSFVQPEEAETNRGSDSADGRMIVEARGGLPVDSSLLPAVSGEASEILVEAPKNTSIEGLWVDVLFPKGMGSLTPFIGGLPVSYSETEVGIRVPVGRLEAGETRRITFLDLPTGA